jgi:hypothetical protein
MNHLSVLRTCEVALLFLLWGVAPLAALEWPEVPAMIRAAVEEEFPGIIVKEVELDDRGGSPVYAVKGEANGAEIELEVATDGKILRASADGIRLIGSEDDHDHDGLRDEDEWALGCDPNDPDTDDDAYPDGFEDLHGSDPRDPASQPQILSIRTKCTLGGSLCLVLSVETFTKGIFQLESGNGEEGWQALGDPFTGNGTVALLEFPLTSESKGGLFRVTLKADPEETIRGGAGSTGAQPCAAPEAIRGLTFLIEDEDGERKTFVMGTSSTGDLTRAENGEVEFYPFDYVYEKTSPCSGTIRITFPTDDEETRGVLIHLTYTAQGVGLASFQQFEGPHFEDTETGTFQLGP